MEFDLRFSDTALRGITQAVSPAVASDTINAADTSSLVHFDQLSAAVEKLNHRPRKVLGFRTPYEVFFGVEVRYTKQPLDIALRG